MNEVIEISADGSLRRFYRVGKKGLILITPAKGPMGIPEQKAYVNIGYHLREKGISVPLIKAFDEESGAILVEDVGETSLYDIYDIEDVAPFYALAVKELALLGIEGRKGFDHSWCHDSPFYDALFAAKREALYFTRFFLMRYMKTPRDDFLEAELIRYAEKIDKMDRDFLIHRDYQSRNLMVKGDSIYIIDFQGAMIGPLFYDLAALLHDPYVSIEERLKMELFELYLNELKLLGVDMDREEAITQYKILSLFRLLQVLGAYAFLTLERKRPFFEKFIPRALERLEQLLIDDEFHGLSALKRSIASLHQ